MLLFVRRIVLLLAIGLFSAINSALAQTDPSLFDTVYNLGAVPSGSIFDIGSNDIPGVVVTGTTVGDDSIFLSSGPLTPTFLEGDTLGSDSQLNLFDGGEILRFFNTGFENNTGSNIEMNIVGGNVGNFFTARNNSKVNITGGNVGDMFRAASGSTVHIAGGSVGNNFDTRGDTVVNISGGNVGNSFNANSESMVNISGGNVGIDFNASEGSTVNISGGRIGNGFDARSNSTVNISGGYVGHDMRARSGSHVNISGGTVGSNLNVSSGSTVNISGGLVSEFFSAQLGSTINISGGTFGNIKRFNSGSTVNIMGGAFKFNGSTTNDFPGGFDNTLGTSQLLTGVLADGRVFILSQEAGSGIAPGTTTLVNTPIVSSTNPGTLSSGTFSMGVRESESLTVNNAGKLGNYFPVVGGKLNIEGGSVGDYLEVAFGEVNISGGMVGHKFHAFSGSTINVAAGTVGNEFEAHANSIVNITGGSVGTRFASFEGSTVNITGGSVGSRFHARDGSIVNISGGSIGERFDSLPGSKINISGGTFGDIFQAARGSEINLRGTDFTLNGVELTELVPGEAFTIFDRDVTLAGLLADGTAFDFELSSNSAINTEYFSPNATVTVTLIPEPASALLLLGALSLAIASTRKLH